MLKKLVFFIVCNLLFVIYYFPLAKAQDLSGSLATEIPISDEVESGDIICSTKEAFTKCGSEYQTSIYGVVTDRSQLAITQEGLENAKLVTRFGIVTVKVSSSAGSIINGNLITTSKTPGVGQLAVRNGYVLGTALEDYTDTNPDNVGRIQVLVNIHPATSVSGGTSSNLLQFIREGLTVPIFEPLESFRYLLAAILIIISFSMGVIYFGRSSARGIEAIGRNPLAKKVIQLTIVLNIVLTLVIVSIGLGIAYLILIL